MSSPINEGDIEIQLVDGDADEAVGAEKQEGDRLEHFYTALNWVKQELAELKEQDQSILQNFLSVRNSLYSIWETHRIIVKEQEEMVMYENDESSEVSPPPVTSPSEKAPLERLGSGLLSSINKYTESKGITSPLLKKPLVTLDDVQESCPINEDIGPSVCAVPSEATSKPWYEAGSYDTMELPRPGKGSRSYLKKSTSNYKKKEHIYDSIDNVLTEMQQNQGSLLGSPNYATLHKWTDKLTSPGSSSNSSSGSNILDSKNSTTKLPVSASTSLVHPVSSVTSNNHPMSAASHSMPAATSKVPVTASFNRCYSNQKRPSSARERKSSARSSLREGSHSPPALHNPPLGSNPVIDVRTNPPSLSDLHDSPTTNVGIQDVMARSQSARWPRKKPQASPRSNSPTTSSSSVPKEGFLTPQLSRSAQNGMQTQSNYYSQDEFDPLSSVCTNFSTEILSSLNFLQQPQSQSGYPTEKKTSMGSRTASSSSTHGRRSVPIQSSPSPDLAVNPLGGPKVSPPPDNQPSAFCHVPKRGRSYSGTSGYAVVTDKSRSRSGSQNNLHMMEVPERPTHASGSPTLKRSSVSYHRSPSSSPGAMRKDVNGDILAAPINSSRGDIVNCSISPRFPRRSVNRSTGQSLLYNSPAISSQKSVPSRPPRPVFTAPAPPTVPPPKLTSYQPADPRPPNNHLTRPASTQKVEQTWC